MRVQRKFQKYPLDPWYLPPTIQIEVTSKCNFRCPHCGSSEIPASLRKDMSMKTFYKMVPFFKHIHHVRLFNYGEPLMNQNFIEMARLVKASSATVGFNTNGMLLEEKTSRKLVELGVDSVVLSIDAATPKTYERIRPDGDFGQVINNFKRLRKIKLERKSKKPRMSFCFTIMRENVKEIPEVVELAKNCGCEEVRFQYLIAFNDVGNEQSVFRLGAGGLERAFEKCRRVAKECGVRIRLPSFEPDHPDRPGVCDYPWCDMQVRADGKVFACNFFPYPMHQYYCFSADGKLINEKKIVRLKPLGDVNKQSLEQIWRGERYRLLRQRFRVLKVGKPCDTCILAAGH